MKADWTLEELVPHAAPMILLDEVSPGAEDSLSATVRITEQSLFFERNRGVPAYVGIEYIAQTVAATAGYRIRNSGGDVTIGYLLGARNYTAQVEYFPLGAVLSVQVSTEFESDDLAAYRGQISDADGRLLAETSITLYSGSIEADS